MAPYRVHVHGVPVDCETPSDAEKLARYVSEMDSARSVRRDRERDGLAMAVKFLELVREGGSQGITSSDLADRLGFEGPRGLGGAYPAVKRHLAVVEISADDLITIVRMPNGENLWRALHPHGIQNAIDRLNQKRERGEAKSAIQRALGLATPRLE